MLVIDDAYSKMLGSGAIDYNGMAASYPEHGPVTLPGSTKQMVGIQAQLVGGAYLTDVALVFASADGQ
jgi:hypothetical protein